MNIDPIVSLAISLDAHKGVYSVLIGSGVSRSAGIPTGWEVVEDLIRRIATAEGEDVGQDAAKWYKDKFGKEPDYSELVQVLAVTPPERTSLLKEYFEPTEQEKEDGLKVPTQAHRSIAHLVARGYIKVIITTNFDRLMESALEDEGINPTVISTPDQIAGMMPLPHVPCLVLKVHGDYLDTRIKNTSKELTDYDDETNRLLGRILLEYGLVVCGWSGEWDVALRNAITRNTRFQFSTYWMVKGEPSECVTDLIKHRQAKMLSINSADETFADIESKVEALANQRLVDPMSPRLAVATMKKFLSEPIKHRIQLQDAIVNELSAVRKKTSLDVMPLGSPEPDKAKYIDRVCQIESACANLVPMVATGVYWDDDGNFDDLWKRCVETLAQSDFRSGSSYHAWSYLQYYPASLVVYAAGIAAIIKQRISLFRVLLLDAKAKEHGDVQMPAAAKIAIPRCFHYESAQWLHELENQSKRKTPGSDWVVTRLKPMLEDVIGDDVDFEDIFDELEFIVALVTADVSGSWSLGRFAWRVHFHGNQNFVKRTEDELGEHGDKHYLLQAGLFNGEIEKLKQALANVKDACGRLH